MPWVNRAKDDPTDPVSADLKAQPDTALPSKVKSASDGQVASESSPPPPLYSPGGASGSAPIVVPSAARPNPFEIHSHAPLSPDQDIVYHQLFTRPSNQVDHKAPGLPVVTLVETYLDDGEIKSSDPKLGDATVLYDFFRLKAAERVCMQASVRGTHTETEVYYTYRTNPHTGRSEQVRQTRTVTVTDFSFTIPIMPYTHEPVRPGSLLPVHIRDDTDITLYTLDDRPSAIPPGYTARSWEKWNKSLGLPGWAGNAAREFNNLRNPNNTVPSEGEGQDQGGGDAVVGAVGDIVSPGVDGKEKDLEAGLGVSETPHSTLPSAKVPAAIRPGLGMGLGLKELCEAYLKDKGRLKTIEMKIGVWGWDLLQLTSAIENVIRATGYHNAITITFPHTPQKVVVRPNNTLTRLRRNTGLMILACITLVYPIIWLILKITNTDGEKYNTIRADHALKTYLHVPGTYPTETLTQACARLHPHTQPHADPASSPSGHNLNADPSAEDDWAHRDLVTGPLGVYALNGMKEGAWLHRWEGKIAEAAVKRIRGVDLNDQVIAGMTMGTGLDGY